jgi:succinoglycan biosynthesis protein ExoA
MVDWPRSAAAGGALPEKGVAAEPAFRNPRPAEPRSFLDGDWEADVLRPRLNQSAYLQQQDFTPAPPAGALAVIPALNEADHIEALIRHLLADLAWDDPLVVVADGGSTDGTREIVARIAARDPRVRLLHNPLRLQSAAVNRAAAVYGRHRRWMVRVDAHAGYPTGYVSRLVAEGERVGAASVVVAMATEGHGGFQSAAAAAQNSLLGAGGSAHRSRGRSGWVDHGHHALFDLDCFLAVGGYDETYVANEDAEFDARLAHADGRIWLSSETTIVYYPRATPTGLFRQYLNYGQGRARTLLRHRLKPKIRQLLPVAIAPVVLAAPLGLLDPVLALPAAFWAGASLSYGALLGLKSRSGAAAASGLAAMIMHLAWSLGFWRQLLAPQPPAFEPRPQVSDGARP